MASKMPIWPTLSSVTGIADIKLDYIIYSYSDMGTSATYESFLEITFLGSFATFNLYL